MTEKTSTRKAKPNMRREALKLLRETSNWLHCMINDWKEPPSLTWYDAGDGKGRQWQRVPRKREDVPASEYQENSVAKLEHLILYMDAVKIRADQIWTLASKRIDELIDESNGGIST